MKKANLDAVVTPSEVEWHRAAAWFAGEGSVRSKDRKLAVSVAQKERAVCDWLRDRFGGSVLYRPPKGGHNEIHYWNVCGDRARAFLDGILPLMPESPRRMTQVAEALEVCAGKRKTGTKPLLVCKRGHVKDVPGGRCAECAKVWRATRFAKPGMAERHRDEERARYHNRPEVLARAIGHTAQVAGRQS